MNLFNKESVIFPAVRNASATFRYIYLIIDETGRAMVIFLPWCDFPLPDVTCLYRRCDMGMMWLFPPDVT